MIPASWPAAGAAVAAAMILGCAACTSAASITAPSSAEPSSAQPSTSAPAASAPGTPVPRPAHVVVVVMENHSFAEVIGSPAAPYINSLAARGADFTRSSAIAHPSEPNYLALFSGSTQGVSSDACPLTFDSQNLAAGLLAAGKTFSGYAEDLPAPGSAVCAAGNYARKHVPWSDFSNVPAAVNQPFTSWPAGDYGRLPTVSFVIPDLCDDMHDCPVATGDAWLRAHLNGYAGWAMTHDSLLIITWDEDDGSAANQIPTIFVGQRVKPGRYPAAITHYSVLRTIEDAFGLPHDGAAASTPPITGIWMTG